MKKLKVLISEGSGLVLARLTARVAEIKGVVVVGEARGYGETLDLACRLRPAVIILDAEMADGPVVLVLKTLKEGARAPMVIATAMNASGVCERKCRGAGADHFIDLNVDRDVNKMIRVLDDRSGKNSAAF